MINARNVLKSTKAYGKYEKPIIRRLKAFFQKQGYTVVPHARLNISWGSIISDIDLLLIKDDRLTAVEVKSANDKLSRAFAQLENVRDYVDYLYLATERTPTIMPMDDVGLIVIRGKQIQTEKQPKLISEIPRHLSFALLHKICLMRLVHDETNLSGKEGKFVLATRAMQMMDESNLKGDLQQMIACGLYCSTKCPILQFEHILRLSKNDSVKSG